LTAFHFPVPVARYLF